MSAARPAPQKLRCPAEHGHLESLLQEPEQPSACAAVCHPHPLFGGTMHNNVVYRMARALVDAGVAVLRFNFRGVEGSTGAYAGGVGEEQDVLAALAFLRQRYPALPQWVAGFSFGARVGLAVGAREPTVQRLLGVGLALNLFDFGFLDACDKPKAFVQGQDDEFGQGARLRCRVEAMAPPRKLWIVPGATHLFPGKLPDLERALAEAVGWLSAKGADRAQ